MLNSNNRSVLTILVKSSIPAEKLSKINQLDEINLNQQNSNISLRPRLNKIIKNKSAVSPTRYAFNNQNEDKH